MKEKKIILVKQEQVGKNKKQYTKGRTCLNCGINIDHRAPKTKFCCPACKASYKEMLELKAKESSVIKSVFFSQNDAASVYYQNEVEA